MAHLHHSDEVLGLLDFVEDAIVALAEAVALLSREFLATDGLGVFAQRADQKSQKRFAFFGGGASLTQPPCSIEARVFFSPALSGIMSSISGCS